MLIYSKSKIRHVIGPHALAPETLHCTALAMDGMHGFTGRCAGQTSATRLGRLGSLPTLGRLGDVDQL